MWWREDQLFSFNHCETEFCEVYQSRMTPHLNISIGTRGREREREKQKERETERERKEGGLKRIYMLAAQKE